jgi:hypothetical protein
MSKALPAAVAAYQRELIEALRDVEPPPPDWAAERKARDTTRTEVPGPTRGGWTTTHEPENQRFLQVGTVDGRPVTLPVVCGYGHALSLGLAGDGVVHAVAAITGEDFSDVLQFGRRRWTGPNG